MGTDYQRVATYLPPEIEACFNAFKIEHGLATEDNLRANDSKALIQILSEYFEVTHYEARQVTHLQDYATVKQLEALECRVNELFELLRQSDSRISNAVSEVKSELKSELLRESKDHSGQLDLLQTSSLQASSSDAQLSNSLSRLPSELLNGMSARKLSERLSIDRKKIAQQKQLPGFAELCRDKDPDGIGWEYREGDKKYYPVDS